LSYKSLKSRKRRIFLPTSYIQGQVRETKEAVESARAGLLPQKGNMRKKRKEKRKTKEGGLSPQEGDVKKNKKRKEKDQGGKKVAPAKARFRVPYTKNFFFLVHKYLGLETANLGRSIGSYETWSTRKPCGKEVPETDYLTQQKQYLKRTTLRTY
jgi:hypothetical protein